MNHAVHRRFQERTLRAGGLVPFFHDRTRLQPDRHAFENLVIVRFQEPAFRGLYQPSDPFLVPFIDGDQADTFDDRCQRSITLATSATASHADGSSYLFLQELRPCIKDFLDAAQPDKSFQHLFTYIPVAVVVLTPMTLAAAPVALATSCVPPATHAG